MIAKTHTARKATPVEKEPIQEQSWQTHRQLLADEEGQQQLQLWHTQRQLLMRRRDNNDSFVLFREEAEDETSWTIPWHYIKVSRNHRDIILYE